MSTTVSPSSSTYEYYCGMTCDGCKGAITRLLSKCEGVESFEADVQEKKLIVKGTANPEAVLEKLSKWANASGKELRLVGKVE
jgi:copper chaperone